jgi:hypothetical protein
MVKHIVWKMVKEVEEGKGNGKTHSVEERDSKRATER